MHRHCEFNNERLTVTVTESFPITERFARFVRALVCVRQEPLDKVLDGVLDDPEEKQLSKVIEEQLEQSPNLMASWLMWHTVRGYGEFELSDTAEEFAQQVEYWREGVPEDCFMEFKLAAASALDLDGEGTRTHFRKAVELAGWDKED